MTSRPERPVGQTLRGLFAKQRGSCLKGLILAAVGASIAYPLANANAASLTKDLVGTPLVLKDGRIARVSIHNVPFSRDEEALGSKTAMQLEALTQSVATDCFLTAQVIGHVDKSEARDRNTVDIHRLARARADTVQSALVVNGLPPESIASVWDWQFIVQDARATLWVFQLVSGDDCADESLAPGEDDQIAALDQETVLEKADEVVAQATTAAPIKQAVVKAVNTGNRASPATSSKPADKVIRSATAPVSSQAAPKAPARPVAAPVQLTALTPPSGDTDKKGRVVVTQEGLLEVTFATNSSYLPQGVSNTLRAFAAQLEQGQGYTVHMQTSYDGRGAVGGSSSDAEAARYNEWLSDRRFERVKTWLLKNSNGADLTIEPARLENDGSRRVLVKLVPYS